MNILILSQIIHPVLGFLSVIVIYTFIIAKRYQKKLLYEEDYERTGREPNIYKITDLSERLWWNFAITIVLIVYLGFVILFFKEKNDASILLDALFMGMVVWAIIAYIGYKITR